MDHPHVAAVSRGLQQHQQSHSPDSGTWVNFDEAGGHLSPAEVHISLPPPPRRGDIPSHPTYSSTSPSLITLPASIPAQQRAELEEIDRVQRILQADSGLDTIPVDI